MRPKGENPNEHFTAMLAGPYSEHDGIMISFPEDEQLPVIDIAPKFARQCHHGFLHLMRFVQSNQLTITINRDECALCHGAEGCLSYER